ncbi:MAG: molybdopterin-dependent oxidoreductase [Rhizobiales bacterium]|nr:molybdopterin-dependent oxidoreductase [Hyphomicrobiales bacterium]
MQESTSLASAAAARPWTGRIEDEALVRGLGHYSDDVRPADTTFAVFVRSPHAFADIRGIDTAAARNAPGVLAVYTGADLAAAHYHSVSHAHPVPGGAPPKSPHRPALAEDRVRHVGELVAVVIGQTLAAAQDAADLIAVDYNPLRAVNDIEQAMAPGAPQIWPDVPGNLAYDWTAPGDPDGAKQAEIDRIFASAAHVAKVSLVNQRIAAATMEPRAATAGYDPATDRFTLHTGTQGVAGIRMQVAEAMGIKPEQLRVLSEDVGGGFGMKAAGYPEYVAILHAARELKRPVHWVSTRGEAFMMDNQARDSLYTVELALDDKGKFLALRADVLGNMGAYLTGVALYCVTVHISGCLPTLYDIPRATIRSRAYYTNSVPIGPYRGAGRPEASYLLERLIDEAAKVSGIDPASLRRRNLISANRIPYKTVFGNTYDSGDFKAVFDRAVETADYKGFTARKRESKKAGKLRGIGIGCYLEIAGAIPDEGSRYSFPGGNRVDVSIGPTAQGQGHRTVFGQVAADRLGIPADQVNITHGDSDRDVPGFGAVASRSAMLTGSAVINTADAVIAKGKKVAAILLQGQEAEVEYRSGAFHIGSRNISLFDVAERAKELVRQGVIQENMDTKGGVKAPPSFPNGCHIAEVEVDPQTGAVSLVRYTVVDDCGRLLNRTIVDGQVHGGVAQGVGQALTEAVVFDPQSGQLLSGSFMDYAMPRAEHLPPMVLEHLEVPCKTNPAGAKGTGEAGATAAPPAVMNAIANALGAEAAAKVEMPATAERIWQALKPAA